MRFRPANIRVIHRRGGSVDQLAGSRLRPRPDDLIRRTRALCSIEHQNTEALSNTQVTIDRSFHIRAGHYSVCDVGRVLILGPGVSNYLSNEPGPPLVAGAATFALMLPLVAWATPSGD